MREVDLQGKLKQITEKYSNRDERERESLGGYQVNQADVGVDSKGINRHYQHYQHYQARAVSRDHQMDRMRGDMSYEGHKT